MRSDTVEPSVSEAALQPTQDELVHGDQQEVEAIDTDGTGKST